MATITCRHPRPVSNRFQRRHIRLTPPGLADTAWREALPPVQASLLRPRRPQVPRTVNGLLQTVIAAVNARGMCATQAAHVADLPTEDLERIESLCQCQGCRLQRAH